VIVDYKKGKEMQYAIITGGLSAANFNTWIKYGEEYASPISSAQTKSSRLLSKKHSTF
jgi:hypothetical protein